MPELRESDDRTADFIKSEQRKAMMETIDMFHCHPHLKQPVRDYCYGMLQAAVGERLAMVQDHFNTVPTTMGKLVSNEEDWCAGVLKKHTQLTWDQISKCRSFDRQLISKMWQILNHTSLSLKLPIECQAKPVMAIVVDQRVRFLESPLQNVTMDDVNILSSGKVNYARIGIYRAKGRIAETTVKHVTHVYSKLTVNIEEEGIKTDFDLEHNWSTTKAMFKKASRTHSIYGMFTKEQREAMQPWGSKSEQFMEMVAAALKKIHDVTSGVKVEEDHEALVKASKEAKVQAMGDARKRLSDNKAARASKRKITVGDGEDELDASVPQQALPPAALTYDS